MTKAMRLILFAAVLLLIISLVKSSLNQKADVAGVNDTGLSTVQGIIIPHHDLAREYFLPFIEGLSSTQQYSTIILIGPNHFEPDSSRFFTTSKFGDYPIDSKFVSKLLDSGYFLENTDLSEHDHSLATPLLYLHHYFPKAKFVTILSPANFNSDKIKDMAKLIALESPKDTLFVASIDFSHDLTAKEALEKNQESEMAIKTFNYQTIYQFKNDHLDSPATAGLLLNLMQNLGSTNWKTYISSHGAFISDNFSNSATSYLIGSFSR